MIRFREIGHAVFLSLIVLLPVLRAGWDQWAQTAVLLSWTFFIVLGGALLWLGRPPCFDRAETAARTGGAPWGAFLALGGASAAISRFPHSAVPSALNDLSSLAFWCLGAGVSDGRRPLYLRGLAGAGLLGTLAGVLGSSGPLAPPGGALLNPNLASALVVLTAPLTLFLAGTSRGRERWFWLAGAAVLASGLILSRSVAGVLVVAAQFAAGSARRARWSALALSGAVLALALGFAHTDWGKIWMGDPDRWAWWRSAFGMAAAHPLLGVGPGAFGEAYPLFRAEAWGLNSLYAHNWILECLAERGSLGLAALAGVVGASAAGGAPGRADPSRRPLFIGAAGFLAYNLAHIGFSFPALAWLFFLTLGLGAAPAEPFRPWTRRVRQGVGLLAALFALAAATMSFRLFRAGQMLERARWASAEGRLEAAADWVEQGIRWDRRHPELHDLRGVLRLRAEDLPEAARDLERAAGLAPGAAGIRMRLAEVRRIQGDLPGALDLLAQVNRRLPLLAEAWILRGDLLASQGRPAEAREAWRGAARAISDPRTLGGDAARRAEAARRVEERLRSLDK